LEKLFKLAQLNEFTSEITETLSSVQGNLYDVKWSYKDIWQVEANFSNLILVLPQAKVRGFSGNLVMNPEVGHLKITKATIVPTDYPVLVTRLNGNIDLKRWQISSKKLQAVINGIPIQVAGDLKMDTVLKTNLLITIENNKLEDLIKYIPEQNTVRQLTEAKLTGNLNSAQFFLQGIGTEFKFKVLALIEQVNLKNYQLTDFNYVSVQNLAGQLEIEPNRSSFSIKRGEVKLELQELYNKPLQFNKILGKLIWQEQQLTIKKLQIYEDKTKILLNGNLTIPQNGEVPNIDLVVSLADTQMSKITSKLPAKKIPEVIEWINNSKLKGNLYNTKAIIHGPINNLSEQFEFKTDFKNTSIKYVDGWPILTQAKGKIVIKEQNLTVTAVQGKSLKLRLNKPLQVKIKDLFNPTAIDVTVNTQDSISDSLHFVARTPLRDIIKLNQIDVQGQLGFNLNLSIPLEQRDIVTNVQLTFSDTTLRNKKFDFSVTNINGLLKFENQQISGKNIRGKLHGTPIKFSIFQTNKSRTILQANTTISPKLILSSLQPFAPEISQLPLSGSTPLNIKINLPSDSETENDYIDVEMQTSLAGMEIKLPAPIGKNADKSKLLTAKIHMDSANKIVINYDKVFNGVFKLQQNELERGNLIFGNKIAQLPKQKILKIQGSLPDLSITNWLEKFESGSSSSKTNDILPIQLDFALNKLEVVGQQLSKVKLEAKYKNSAWLATIKSDKIEGQIDFQPDKISLNFKKIILSLPEETEKTTKVTKTKSKSLPPNPHDLPILSFKCDSLKIAAADLGRIKLKTKPSDDGIKMNLTAQSDAANLRAEGQWRYVVGQHQTRLKATLDSDDMGLMLQQFGLSEPLIVGGGSKINLNSYWFDAPYAVDSENLIGTLSIVTLAGNIVKANPGIGRVFGLIDVYSLPRRLNLDFRDVFDEGFGFDTIAGSFFIKKGIAHTEQFIIQGPAARIKIEGSTNLIDKKFNQIATVYPHFSTPIAVIGALTLGLGGGAVGLIVQEALQKELEPVVNIKFHVTGDWKDPKINGE
ncbi:MAG: hypothetical protein KAG43_02080, partial [Candidatus Marithrix sp.]|nr:hypothetical protein [Candidatus Marithrix sp.]